MNLSPVASSVFFAPPLTFKMARQDQQCHQRSVSVMLKSRETVMSFLCWNDTHLCWSQQMMFSVNYSLHWCFKDSAQNLVVWHSPKEQLPHYLGLTMIPLLSPTLVSLVQQKLYHVKLQGIGVRSQNAQVRFELMWQKCTHNFASELRVKERNCCFSFYQMRIPGEFFWTSQFEIFRDNQNNSIMFAGFLSSSRI